MAVKECTQTRCSFHKSKGGQMFCPICSECNAPSNIVEDDTCINCHNCLNDEGYIRKGLPKALKEKIEQMLKKELGEKIIIMNKSE